MTQAVRYRGIQKTLFGCGVLAALSAFATAAPPELRFDPGDGVAHPGSPYRMRYTVEWTGAPDAWLILPPELPAPEWTETYRLRTLGSGAEGAHRVEFEVMVVPREAGVFTWPALSIPVAVPAGSGRVLEGGPERVLEAEAVEIEVREPRFGLWLGGGALIAAFLVVAGGWGYRRRRQRKTEATLGTPSPYEQARMGVHEARRHRLDGDWYAFYRALGRAMARLRPEADALTRRFEARANEVGYGGIRPTDDELDGAMRDAERALTDWKQHAAP